MVSAYLQMAETSPERLHLRHQVRLRRAGSQYRDARQCRRAGTLLRSDQRHDCPPDASAISASARTRKPSSDTGRTPPSAWSATPVNNGLRSPDFSRQTGPGSNGAPDHRLAVLRDRARGPGRRAATLNPPQHQRSTSLVRTKEGIDMTDLADRTGGPAQAPAPRDCPSGLALGGASTGCISHTRSRPAAARRRRRCGARRAAPGPMGCHPPAGPRACRAARSCTRSRACPTRSTGRRVFGQLQYLVDNQAVHRAFPAALGGEDDHGGNIAGFEELVIADPSLQIKAGVQWGLFGSAVMHLGTEEHHRKWLPGIMNLDIPGCFAMTETGHGSDVASIATTATYDAATQEFVIHTPFRAAWKDYIGNAAIDGTRRRRLRPARSRRASTTASTPSTSTCAIRARRTSCPGSAARTTASRAASTESTTAGCTSPTSGSRAPTCSTATATSTPTAPTAPPSPAPAGASSRCSAPWSRAGSPWTVPP